MDGKNDKVKTLAQID